MLFSEIVLFYGVFIYTVAEVWCFCELPYWIYRLLYQMWLLIL